MRPGRAADHLLPSSAAVIEEYPPSGPHRACKGITLPLPLYIYIYIYIYICLNYVHILGFLQKNKVFLTVLP